MKKLFMLPLGCLLMASCNNDDITMEEVDKNVPKVSVVQIIDGNIVPLSRNANGDSTNTALAFADEAAFEEFKANLETKSTDEKLELLDEYGIDTVHHLADIADDELEQIANEAVSEEDFRKKYKSFVEKFNGKLIPNYLDDTDLDLYVPEGDKVESYIGNKDGLFVVDNEIKKANLAPVLPAEVIEFYPMPKPSPSLAEKPTNINSYVIEPKRHKRVYFTISRRYSTIHIHMEVRKKMWYGWKNDPHRILIFEPHFAYTPAQWIGPHYTRFWTKGKKKIETDILRLTGTGKLTGTIYTWTDFSAEYDAKNNLIIEHVGNTMAPRCLVSKSETVQVEL